jgi:hypothetical protein
MEGEKKKEKARGKRGKIFWVYGIINRARFKVIINITNGALGFYLFLFTFYFVSR